jgi:hypothetical protein
MGDLSPLTGGGAPARQQKPGRNAKHPGQSRTRRIEVMRVSEGLTDRFGDQLLNALLHLMWMPRRAIPHDQDNNTLVETVVITFDHRT